MVGSTEISYSKLKRKSRRLEVRQFEIPEPNSFESVEECENKYREIEQTIEKWKSAKKNHDEIYAIRLTIEWKVERVGKNFGYPELESPEEFVTTIEHRTITKGGQVPETSTSGIWLEYLPEVEPPEEFDTAIEATDKYNSIKKEITRVEPVIIQAAKLEAYLQDFFPSVNQVIHEYIEENLSNQQELQEVQENIYRLGDTLSIWLRIQREANAIQSKSFDSFIFETMEHVLDEDFPESEKLQESHNLIQKVEKILTFMHNVNLSHPSIDAEHWEESMEIALEEQYVNILLPIADQVEKMESGIWDLDDLYQISWQDFETLIGTLYESFGYKTEVTPDTADMGIDVWITNLDERIAIQAKHYREGNRVGRETLQKLASTLAKGDADRVIVVTTSEFTRTAKEYSNSFGSEINLINGEELREKLNNSDIPPIN